MSDGVDELPVDIKMENTWGYYGVGKLTDDLPEDYNTAKLDVSYLQTLLDTADVLGWEHVTIALKDEYPLVLYNHYDHGKVTLTLAPIETEESEVLSDE